MTTPTATDCVLAITTVATAEDARGLVGRLVEQRVAACGTVLDGATSIYRWEGAIEEAREVLVLLKTHRTRLDDLKQAVRDTHPYEVPELLAFTVADGAESYLQWVAAETAPTGKGTP